MSTTYSYIFFGSFQHYSILTLEKLLNTEYLILNTIVTTPPMPSGRHLKPTPSAVATYAKDHNLPVLELDKLNPLPPLGRPDFIIVAGYGKLLPPEWLAWPKIMAINMHASLLPNYPGRFPAEWAILRGETETGVTLIKMSDKFDQGEFLANATIPILPKDTKETLYSKLYTLGGELLVDTLPKIASGEITPQPQPPKPANYFYAKTLTRQDGFVPYEEFSHELSTMNHELQRKYRALHPWPGVWTIQPNGKRLKLIQITPEILVQEEGKTVKKFANLYS